ncbi:MAG: VWA domain-containing protein [bacterium]|nr:VWA domain-containing protein [bacterium]
MILEHERYLSFLWLIIPLALIYIYADRRGRLFAGRDRDKSAMTIPGRVYSSLRAVRVFKQLLFSLGIAFLIFALAGPKWGMKEQLVERKGIDIVLALDLSKSMLATDISPSRLERAKLELSRFIDSRQGDRIGLVAFAGGAVVACPLTVDYLAAKNFLRSLDTDLMPQGGTDIAGAIKISSDLMKGYVGREKVMVILTDGEDTVGDAEAVARDAASEGMAIYTLGFGSRDGSPIPVYDKNGKVADYKKDKSGKTVISRLGGKLLSDIANSGNGKSFMGSSAVSSLAAELDRKEKSIISSKMFTLMEERFQYPLFIALLFFLAEAFIPERRKDS